MSLSFRIIKDENLDTLSFVGGGSEMNYYQTTDLPSNTLVPSAGTFPAAPLQVNLTRIGNLVTMTWGNTGGTLSTNAIISFGATIPPQFIPNVSSPSVAVNGPIYVAAGGALSFYRIGVYSNAVQITTPALTPVPSGSVQIFPGSLSWVVDL